MRHPTQIAFAVAAACFCGASCSESPTPARPADTRVNETLFDLTLPGPWSRLDANETTFTYQRQDGSERLTVSLALAKRALTEAERIEAMEQFVERTRAAERDGTTLSDVGRGKMAGRLMARYEGSDESTGRLFTCLIMSNSTVVASFYFESSVGDKQRFLENARAALTNVTLRERPSP
jgi:hypothetical protein